MRQLAALLVLALALPAAPAVAEDDVGLGLPAPAFTLKTLNPDSAGVPSVSLEQYVGAEPEDPGAKVVLLSFFASWCGPCQKEMPFLIQLDRMYREARYARLYDGPDEVHHMVVARSLLRHYKDRAPWS